MKFRYEDEAVELANDSIYGLGASIFTSDANKASRVSSKLNAGVIAINEVIVPVANMALPFGELKQVEWDAIMEKKDCYPLLMKWESWRTLE